MTKIQIAGIVGARPNFMKIAPLYRLLRRHPRLALNLIHTGQHYNAMSDPFFRELGLPDPDFHLKAGSQPTAAMQVGLVITRLVPILQRMRPAAVLVVGDVNSTLAGAIAAHKLGIPVGHIEAGLRSFDETMPEEINRRITDSLSDYCFTPSADGDRNLRNEGVLGHRIFRVGNLMIDTLLRFRPKARRSKILEQLHLRPRGYALLTLHRPSNVDSEDDLRKFDAMLREIGDSLPVVFPIHPRTLQNGIRYGIWKSTDVRTPGDASREARGLILTPPLGYLDFLRLQESARFVMTDSGGVQEETTVLGVPCLTLRKNTERPVTITHGTNRLAGVRPSTILRHVRPLLNGYSPKRRLPPLWDGNAAARVVKVLEKVILSR